MCAGDVYALLGRRSRPLSVGIFGCDSAVDVENADKVEEAEYTEDEEEKARTQETTEHARHVV